MAGDTTAPQGTYILPELHGPRFLHISTISTAGMNQGVVVMPGGGGFIVWMSTNTMDTHGFVFLGVQGTIYSLGWRALPGDCAE